MKIVFSFSKDYFQYSSEKSWVPEIFNFSVANDANESGVESNISDMNWNLITILGRHFAGT